MGTSTIEWTDRTWNPVTGCTPISEGCDRCYAASISRRFAGTAAFPNGFEVTAHPDRIDAPLRWTKPSMVFVNSMSDLFHQDVPDELIAQVFDTMEAATRHTFQVLTKRPARMRSFVSRRQNAKRIYADKFDRCPTPQMRNSPAAQDARARADTPPSNIWLGISAETQHWADVRLPLLLQTPAAVRFVSAEPLLEPIDFTRAVRPMGSERGHGLTASYVHNGACCTGFHGLDWVIVGGESGPGARPMDPAWAHDIVSQCRTAGVSVFVKQLGSAQGRDHKSIDTFPAALQVREYPAPAARTTLNGAPA